MPAIDTAKRSLLRGRISTRSLTHRMPWKVADFTDRCQRCGDCLAACAEKVIVEGDGGFPTVDFHRGGCTLCADCVTACRHGALLRVADQSAWSLIATIDATCLSARGIACRSCGEACELQAIRFRLVVGGKAIPELDSSICNGCGSCVSTCPVKAIHMEEAA